MEDQIVFSVSFPWQPCVILTLVSPVGNRNQRVFFQKRDELLVPKCNWICGASFTVSSCLSWSFYPCFHYFGRSIKRWVVLMKGFGTDWGSYWDSLMLAELWKEGRMFWKALLLVKWYECSLWCSGIWKDWWDTAFTVLLKLPMNQMSCVYCQYFKFYMPCDPLAYFCP